jgi:hypothetical protein
MVIIIGGTAAALVPGAWIRWAAKPVIIGYRAGRAVATIAARRKP